MNTQPEVRVERGPVTKAEPFAIGMAKLLEREGRTVAAAELRRQHGEIKSMQAERRHTERRLLAVEAQRDALLEALKSTGLFLHHCWCDVQMNDHSFEKLNQQMIVVDAAIKAVEGEKA